MALDFENIKSAQELINELVREAHNDPDLRWLNGVLSQTAHEYIRAKLDEAPAQLDVYAPWLLSENLREAANLLNNSIDRMNEVQALKAEAINIALEMSLSKQLRPLNLKIDKVRLDAARHQANVGPGDDTADATTLDTVHELIKNEWAARRYLHDVPGGALNYRDRTKFLLNLLVANIRNAYERLYAVKAGLLASFGVSTPAPPDWTDSESLTRLLDWLRQSSRMLDAGEKSERVCELCLLVKDHKLGDASQLARKDAGRALVKFAFKRSDIPGLQKDETVRVVAFGVSLIFDDIQEAFRNVKDKDSFLFSLNYLSSLRDSLRARCIITPPKSTGMQSNILSDVRSFSDKVAESLQLHPQSLFENADPLGDWTLDFSEDLILGGSKVPRHKPCDLEFPNTPDFFIAKDVLISMRLAIRKNRT